MSLKEKYETEVRPYMSRKTLVSFSAFIFSAFLAILTSLLSSIVP